jgi:V8-like Glu-specific endopeptidase
MSGHAILEGWLSLKTRRLLCAALAVMPLSSVAVGPAAAGARDRAVTFVDTTGGERSASYWTPARVRAATPLGVRDRPADADAGAPDGTPVARSGRGSRVVGALFFNDGAGNHYCTASVIRTSKRNLLLTAAHCLYNAGSRRWHNHIVFVPKYSRGARPYGTWPIWLMVVDRRWIEHADPDLDVGFAAVQVMGGRRIADVVGSNQLLIDQGGTGNVLVIGYPSKASVPADRPISCEAKVHRQDRYQMRFDCRGFYGGTSGSPWLKGYDPRTQSGYVIGVIGGYEQGGDVDWRSYSPLFDRDVAQLIVTANNRA